MLADKPSKPWSFLMCRKLALAATILAFTGSAALAEPPASTPPAGPAVERKPDPTRRAQADRLDPLARASFWANEAATFPDDIEAGLKLSTSLRGLGQFEEAAEAAKRITTLAPSNVEALLALARARVAQGQGFYAIEPARQVQQLAPRDWRAPSLLGIAYEQVGRTDDAVAAYNLALQLSPNNPDVLTNLGLFYAGQGRNAEAEVTLRRAAAQPGAGAKARQNLALVLGLQGKLAEAEQILRQDLPPDQANNNLAYLKAVSEGAGSATRSWDSLKTGG